MPLPLDPNGPPPKRARISDDPAVNANAALPPTPTKAAPAAQSPQSEEAKLAAVRDLGERFLDAILNNPFETLPNKEEGEGAPGVGEMRLWRDIPDLENLEDLKEGGTLVNIVLRNNIEPFWQSCIDRVDIVNPLRRYRVCAVGTPGIGKTRTTPLLLRMLLLKNSTVVYIRKSSERKSWYYEFIPKSDGTLPYTVNVYPEASKDPFDFPTLLNKSAYYVVDPGKSKISCDPDTGFPARVIIISSPNDRHWGEEEFEKLRGTQSGVFHYFPLWNLNEVLCGSDYFPTNVTLSPQQIAERYREVGGVPRNLFLDDFSYRKILEKQENAAAEVTEEQATRIVSGKLDPLGNLNSKFPKSAVIGIELADNDHGAFTERKAVPISAVAAEQVFLKHITTLWNDMVANERPLVFESYLRTVLTRVTIDVHDLTEQGIRTFEGNLTAQGNRTFNRSALPSKIGGYSGIQIVLKPKSIVKAAIDCPTANILFYSSDPRYPLIDFACKDSNGTILAFQATTGSTHTADETKIADLEDEVGGRGLMLYYLHTPGGFKTTPATPKTRFCWIFHLEIPKPEAGVTPAVAAEDPKNE